MKVRDKEFELFISKEKIRERVKELASDINEDYHSKDPLFISVLNGSFMFASDLMKNIEIPSEISFVRVSSYDKTQSTGRVKKLVGLQEEVKNRNVVIVEDIVDSGYTLDSISSELKEGEPASLEIVTILFKPENLVKEVNLKYVGFKIPNKFVVGYGLDYDGHGRNLQDIYQIKD